MTERMNDLTKTVAGQVTANQLLSQNLAAFLIICVISTIVTFAATAYTVQFVSRLMNRKGGGKA